MPYAYITLSQALTQLAERLDDPSNVYWSQSELTIYLQESFRMWQSISGYWRGRMAFNTQASVPFYDLTAQPGSILPFTITSSDMISEILYHLLEKQLASGGVYQGTDMFTLDDITQAIERRRNQFLVETGMVLIVSTINAGSPPVSRVQLSDKVIDVRRVAVIEQGTPYGAGNYGDGPYGGTSIKVPLWRTNEFGAQSFNPGWAQNPSDPTTGYSVAVTPPVTIALIPPQANPVQLELITLNAGDPVSLTPQSASDPLNGTNLNPLDPARWLLVPGLNPLQILNNQCEGTNVSPSENGMIFDGIAWPGDQSVTITLQSLSGIVGDGIGIGLRLTADFLNGYIGSISGNLGAGQGTLAISKINGGVITTLISFAGLSFSASDEITFSAVGTKLSIYQNSLIVGSFSDGDFATGLAGILLNATVLSQVAFTNFVGGAASSNALGVPDNLAWVVKWGALADLLSKAGQAQDLPRAKYCEQRWREGIQIARVHTSAVWGSIDGAESFLGSIDSFDSFNPMWEASVAPPTDLALGSWNLLAVSPPPDTNQHSVRLDVVQNAPVPVLPGDFLQIGREELDVIFDYTEHLALFKVGGGEFLETTPLYDNMLREGGTYNERLQAQVDYLQPMADRAQREEILRPRRVPIGQTQEA